jgi:CTP synthase (UTP-ammonia lyase)
LTDHPFFIGTLFVPQARSTVDCPHPLVNAFLQAALQSHPVGV